MNALAYWAAAFGVVCLSVLTIHYYHHHHPVGCNAHGHHGNKWDLHKVIPNQNHMTYGAKKKNLIRFYVKWRLQLPMEKYVPKIKIFFCNNVLKNRGEIVFEILYYPFEGLADVHNKTVPYWLCELAGGSKGQCTISKIISSLLLPIYIIFQKHIFS